MEKETRDPNANFIELRCYTVEVQSQLQAASSRDANCSRAAVFTSGFAVNKDRAQRDRSLSSLSARLSTESTVSLKRVPEIR